MSVRGVFWTNMCTYHKCMCPPPIWTAGGMVWGEPVGEQGGIKWGWV